MARKTKIKIDFKKIEKELIRRAAKTLPTFLKKIIVSDYILRGKSPVKGKGRYEKYSQSYIDQIKMKVAFWTNKSGKVVALSKLSSKELKSFRASKTARKDNRKNAELIKRLNAHLKGKKTRPVNLRVSGKLINSFFVKQVGSKFLVGFSDDKAVYHNNDGVGPKKVKREMLPTEVGQSFARPIIDKVVNHLTIIAKKILKGR